MEIGIAFENSEDWTRAAALVRDKYQRSFGAEVMPRPDCFAICNTRPRLGDQTVKTAACAGVTFAESRTLFSETYLDDPIDVVLSRLEGEPIQRSAIAEIGSLASIERYAGVELVKVLPILTWCLRRQYV